MKKVPIINVAFKDNTVLENKNLPLPIILYPGFYGTFFGFKKNRLLDSKIYLCACSLVPIENYIKLRNSKPGSYEYAKPHIKSILSSSDFPFELVDNLINNNFPNNEEVINYLEFKENICHECNQVIPKYRYCVEMYGSVFKQNFGWYINKQTCEFGINKMNRTILRQICPQEILDLLMVDPENTFNKIVEYRNKRIQEKNNKLWKILWEKENELEKKLQKQNRRVWNVIENEVRQKFGHKNIGEAWTSETILYYIIKKLYPKFEILRHYRPKFLERLEIDIFIKDLNIAIEYQGIQHYKPIKHWGGEDALEKLKKRDAKKKNLCEQNNVKLIYFEYNENLSDDYVYKKMESQK